LFWTGVVADLLGIFCLAGSDYVPWKDPISRWLRRIENRVRRLLGLPRRAFVLNAEAGSYAITGFSASGMVSPGADVTSLDEKVEYLVRRDQAAQRDLNALGRRVERLADELPRQLARSERELKDHVARALADADEKYRPLRQLGAFLFVVGVVCLALATALA
jgi:hypothetical protein